jgi:hypothetical protein
MRTVTLATLLLAAVSGARADFELDVFSGKSYTGTEKQYVQAGTHSLGFTAVSWLFYNESPPGCCVTFCNGKTQTGYRCNTDSADSNVASQYRFNKVVITCDKSGPPACY